MNDEYGRDLSDLDVQQDYIDKVAIGLEKELGLDHKGVIKALLDWAYVNNDQMDWLEFAARDSIQGLSDFHAGDLKGFVDAAMRAWRKESGKEGNSTVPDVLEQIEDLIQVYREQQAEKRKKRGDA